MIHTEKINIDFNSKAPGQEPEEKDNVLLFILKNVIVPIAIVVLLTKFVIVNAYVPSGSMENTIHTGDYLIGSRLDHSYNRGDIIIFYSPETEGMYLIKRIIGVPGDKVEIRQDMDGVAHVYINGTIYAEDYLKEPMIYDKPFSVDVEESHYFVMGDNRNHSYDARFWNVHTIDESSIVGVAKFKYWPINELGLLN